MWLGLVLEACRRLLLHFLLSPIDAADIQPQIWLRWHVQTVLHLLTIKNCCRLMTCEAHL